MDSLGPFLRSAREAKGVDLRDAAQQTRISINFLKAMEDEDFSRLPGEVFVKGFLKSYARFLDLNEEEVMRRYAERAAPAVSAAPQKAEKPKAVPTESTPAPEPSRMSWEPYLWGGLAVLAVAALLLVVVPERRSEQRPIGQEVSHPSGTPPLVTAEAGTARPEKLYLEIDALEDLWVLVRTDASPQKKTLLKKGETITWSADNRFLISYGGIGSARLVLNGKELTVAGPRGAVVRDMTITSAGIAYQKFEPEETHRPRPRPATRPTSTSMPQAQAPVPAKARAVPPATAPTVTN
jgi:hypothetical protein